MGCPRGTGGRWVALGRTLISSEVYLRLHVWIVPVPLAVTPLGSAPCSVASTSTKCLWCFPARMGAAPLACLCMWSFVLCGCLASLRFGVRHLTSMWNGRRPKVLAALLPFELLLDKRFWRRQPSAWNWLFQVSMGHCVHCQSQAHSRGMMGSEAGGERCPRGGTFWCNSQRGHAWLCRLVWDFCPRFNPLLGA